MRDSSKQRLARLQALRDAGPAASQPRFQAPAGRRFTTAGGSGEGGMRAKLLGMLTAVEEDEPLVPGTEVGQRQLEQLINWLDSAEGRPQMEKLRDRIVGLLDPQETAEGMEFDAEGVKKLLGYLRQPAAGRRAGPSGWPRGRGEFAGRPGRRFGRRWR